MRRQRNRAPAWARGSFIWKLVLSESRDSLIQAAEIIRSVANRLDGVRQIIHLTGAIGADEGKLPWDGVWPYWQRLSYRAAGGDWYEMGRFMLEMRDRHDAWITFHVNLTDVNPGLRLYPETRAFFRRLRAARAIYTRPQGINNGPWSGLPSVLEHLPQDRDPSDIVGLVHYQRYWDSGLAREQIDGLLDRLPFVPPQLYVDVLGPKGWCHHPGYPDGDLGGSLASQMSGIRSIVDYLRSHGCEVAGESPDRLTEQPIDYSWSHGGLASNDYAKIGSGFGMGAMSRRGGKAMQVYGNQGGYHVQCGSEAPALVRGDFEDPRHSRLYDGIREFGDADDLVRQFHLTVAPELHHIGNGAVKLPGGPGWQRLDEMHGRVRIDALTLRGPGDRLTVVEAEAGTLLGTASIVDDAWASGGKAVGDIDLALGNGVEFTVQVPAAGTYTAFLRYASPGGAIVALAVGSAASSELDLPDTGAWNHYGDHRIRLRLKAGRNAVRVRRGLVSAAWSDGARAEWSLEHGFRAWNGDVTLGIAGDRFCPDTWSGRRRILLYSQDGGTRIWRLPPGWQRPGRLWFIPLTAHGPDLEHVRRLPVRGRSCRVSMLPGQTAELTLSDGRGSRRRCVIRQHRTATGGRATT